MNPAIINAPAETDLVCEGCGYVMNGLPTDARCPECGKPAAESAPTLRHLSTWEQLDVGSSRSVAFLSTTLAVLFRPTQFYRTLTTRFPRNASKRFALAHWVIVSLLIGSAAYAHLIWYVRLGSLPAWAGSLGHPVVVAVVFTFVTYAGLALTTRAAAWLTNWEATYRGYRLPLPVVLRGLDYHSVHYLPVALVTAATVWGYQGLLHWHATDVLSAPVYLYSLCGEVVAGAVYLFYTYWIGMRNMMYANA